MDGSDDDIAFGTNEIHSITESLRRESKSLYSRLMSIADDARFVKETAALFPGLPVVANERCGTWYVDPQLASAASAYFKSTDGHSGNWKFSLRRANTQLLEVLGAHHGCLIVDSTRRGKSMPDAFSKTIPIWCAVWTRAIARQRERSDWDTGLYTPPQVVSRSEHAQVEQLVDSFVAALVGSGIDIPRYTQGIDKPLRAIWVTRDQALHMPPDFSDAPFTPVVCVSASSIVRQRVEACGQDGAFMYIQGSADDHETWAMGLTPRLFWKHKTRLLADSGLCDSVAKEIVEKERERNASGQDGVECANEQRFNVVANTCISVGDRVSGRPPECWQQFDAIINCGSPEYEPNRDPALKQRYLFLDIPEGKKGQVALEKSIPSALEFAKPFVQARQRLLIHCSQGMDRSVGIALAVLAKYVGDDGQVCENSARQITKELIRNRLLWITTSRSKANPSRVTLKRVNRHFLDFF